MAVMPPVLAWRRLVELALEEDLGPGDATTEAVIDGAQAGEARIEAREPLVVCGLAVAEAVFRAVDPEVRFESRSSDGASVGAGDVIADVRGGLRGLLAAERTALNFVQRMSGVATWTRRFVDAIDGTGARILDTRKTLPGWRVLDKYATAVGGATNHRAGLFDGILLKDNHIAAAGGVGAAVKAVLARAPAHLRLQVEVESEAQAREALEAGADSLLLDNRHPDELRHLVETFGDRALLEASGGVTLANVRAVAETGVHRVSIGALTHSAPAADIAMEIARAGGVRE